MNTLKPLLIVAVLAGIGYGVYVRLNAGSGAPPPPVEPGWNASPSVQLPGQTGGAPWANGVPGGGAPSGPPPGVEMPGGEAPAYQPSQAANAAGEAPPFGQAPPGDAMPPGSAPPYSADAMAGSPVPPGGVEAAPGDMPYEYLPPHDGTPDNHTAAAAPGEAPADPYADPYGAASSGPDRYGSPEEQVPPGDYPPADGYPTSDAPPPYDAPPGGDPAMSAGGDFAAALGAAQHELESGQLAQALAELTHWYGNPQLTPEQQQQLNALLDQVAGTVVYSTQNVLEPPYEVQPGERLEMIGEKYQVPWQLLAKINGIDDPAALQPGERLKVVRGPFHAEIHLERRELVLLTADNLYAGRFRIGVGSEHPPQEGTFAVSEKVENPVYYGRERAIGAEDPNNPLGERWIGLGKQMSIHGTNNPESIGRTDLPGSISLTEQDVEDVFDILSLGSRVTIRR